MRKKKPQAIHDEEKTILYYDESQQNLVMIPAPSLETFASLVARLSLGQMPDVGAIQHIRKFVPIAYDLWCESHLGLSRSKNAHHERWGREFDGDYKLAVENQRIVAESKRIAGRSTEFPLNFDDAVKLTVTKGRSKKEREIAFTKYLNDSKVEVFEPEIHVDNSGRKTTVHRTCVEITLAHLKENGFSRRHLCEYAREYKEWNKKDISTKRKLAGRKSKNRGN